MSCQVPVKFTLTPVGIQNRNTGKGIGAAALPPALWSPPQNLGAVFGYHPDRHALGLGEFSIQEKGNFNTRYHHISSYIMLLS